MGRKKIFTEGSETISVRITKKQKQSIQHYVDQKHAKDISDFVRKAIEMTIHWLERAI